MLAHREGIVSTTAVTRLVVIQQIPNKWLKKINNNRALLWTATLWCCCSFAYFCCALSHHTQESATKQSSLCRVRSLIRLLSTYVRSLSTAITNVADTEDRSRDFDRSVTDGGRVRRAIKINKKMVTCVFIYYFVVLFSLPCCCGSSGKKICTPGNIPQVVFTQDKYQIDSPS